MEKALNEEKSGQEMRGRGRERGLCFLLADSGGQLGFLGEIRNRGKLKSNEKKSLQHRKREKKNN